jgi:hypothetical protein
MEQLREGRNFSDLDRPGITRVNLGPASSSFSCVTAMGDQERGLRCMVLLCFSIGRRPICADAYWLKRILRDSGRKESWVSATMACAVV